MAVLCVDDANVRAIMPLVTKPITTYGLSEQAQIRGVDIRHEAGRMHFRAQIKANGAPAKSIDAALNLPGVHNVQNALAAIAVGLELQVPERAIVRALAEFKGVGRRFQRYGEIALPGGGTFTLIDDYWRQCAAPSPAAGCCWLSSRIATRARAMSSRTSCVCSRRSTRCFWPKSIQRARHRSSRPTDGPSRVRFVSPAK
jgi:UDP-N-acetylmuramate--alanine ligase